MRKQPILHFREPAVDIILRRQLAKEGYRILPKVGLCDALEKGRDDYLPQREFDYFTRAHLDFLVTRDNMPVFAVEFDGAHHFADERTIENDVIKNRLCKQAELPLLRITSSEIEEYDKITLLDYMLIRYVAWGKEYPSIMREIEEFAATIGPDYDPDNLAVDLDPSFRFDLRHPFQDREIVVERLWRNHRIAWSMIKPERHRAARYLCDVAYRSAGPSENEQFFRCIRRASVWRPTRNERSPVFSEEVSVTLRSWLPLRTEVPSPDVFQALGGEIGGPEGARKAQEIIDQFRIRVESMWFPELPGISSWDVAENYAEYLGFRAVERWVKKRGTVTD
jgi:hypothetical protein